MRHRETQCVASVAVLTLVLGAVVTTQPDDYRMAQEAWRADREARLVADDGWLTVAALHFLRQGENSFGASPLNDMVLPEGPASAGIYELRGREVFLRATGGEPLVVDGESVTSMQVYPTERRMTLAIGDLSLWVHYSGERLAIRMRDTNSAIRKNFTGLKWFSDR